MLDNLEKARDWFLDQSNPVKLGIIIFTGIVIILIIFLLLSLVFPNNAPLTGDALINYEASCNIISFQDLNSNLNRYNGQHFKFTGQIVQINENNGVTDIVMSVTQVNDGWSSSDLIFVTYNTLTTFNVGNVINVYGDASGSYTYMSTTLGELNIPQITARFIELEPVSQPTVVPVPFTGGPTNNSNTTNTNGTVTPISPTTPTNNSNSHSTKPI